MRRGTYFAETVEHRVGRRHLVEPAAARPPVGSELGLERVLLDVEQRRELRDVLWSQLRLCGSRVNVRAWGRGL